MPQAPTGVLFSLEKIYVKDSSFEAPNTPQVFLGAEPPAVSVQIGIRHSAVDVAQGMHEVLLSVTVDAKGKDGKNIFLAEVHQAGLFRITGLPNLKEMLAERLASDSKTSTRCHVPPTFTPQK